MTCCFEKDTLQGGKFGRRDVNVMLMSGRYSRTAERIYTALYVVHPFSGPCQSG